MSKKEEVLIHGCMKYRCKDCGKTRLMFLEVGVEDFGKHGRPHQPSPFMIRCPECGELAQDISGYMALPTVRPLLSGQSFFAYDHSGREDACGRPAYSEVSDG